MPATDHAVALTRVAARAAAEKKADRIIAIDVSERLALTDVFLILSGDNDRQVRALVDAIDEAMLRAGARRRLREGLEESHWVLVDYSDIIVHVQQTEDREYYSLERLWKDCPHIDLSDEDAPASADAPGAPDLTNATLPVPKGCIAGDGSATFSQGRAAALGSSGANTFVYIRHPVSVMDTASGPLTLVPLECHAENKDLFHTVIAAYTSGLTLAGAQEMREVNSGAEAAIITALSVSGQSVHLDWVNQEAPGDQNCHLCSTGIGHLDLTWTGSGFSTSNFVIDH